LIFRPLLFQADAVALDLDHAIPCGLILNELKKELKG
jgi:two-component sensor histidine kinase